jgi:hypothetical protein
VASHQLSVLTHSPTLTDCGVCLASPLIVGAVSGNLWSLAGEPEILMLTHVLRAPIAVYMADAAGLRCIGTYGEEYANKEEGGEEEEQCAAPWPVRVLFHGAGHYEALLPLPSKLQSRL